ncbi:ABC transporter permease [Bdellovibrio sp. ZAP7]|uniref:ABC transporter permease n=1 Tax=Bdellovibrio sp. ZAP7 TaxID=2231053 RepID=UPI00115AB26F|nr:ABC transporter permease [Bdellovibrio sp. ZAP7]QDK45094.1 ABC transporter permease [Bdellovibrio sp. ZAP7]
MNRNALVWIAWKLLNSKRTLFGGAAPLALFGLVLGVASLVVSMAVMSGFETTLQKAMTDVSGYVQVVKRSRFPDDWRELEEKIRKADPKLVSAARFVFVEGIMAHNGQISGVLLEGIDKDRVNQTLNLGSRVKEGSADLSQPSDVPLALIGSGLAKKMGLQIGDQFRVVLPIADSSDPSSFNRKVGTFKLQGVVELGKYEWNERFIMIDLKVAQEVAAIGDRYTGLMLKFDDAAYAREAGFRISTALGSPYWVRDWRDSNENLFDAVAVERPVIFFVVSIIIFVAAFNISSSLFVNVMQRFKDIAILKTVGVSRKDVIKIFAAQGLILGAAGLILGFILGLILCVLFNWAQGRLGLISGAVYRVDSIQVNIRFLDTIAICVATMLICFLATLAPAKRGADLNPMEGLRNE